MTGEEAVDILPASIRVGPFDYAIRKMPTLEANCRNVYGECSNREMHIRMSGEGFPDAVKAADTFIHELNHAIWFSFGVEDDDKQERTVNLMSTGWTSVYRANPWLLGWLTDCLK